MTKTTLSGLCGTALLALSISTTSLYAGSPVKSVELVTEIKSKSQMPVIIVKSNGQRYTHISTHQMRVPVRITASCRGKHQLMRTKLTVGTFSITGGHMRDKQNLAHQELRAPAKAKKLPWQKHMFTISTAKMDFSGSMDPVKACNSFLNARVARGMRKQFFMQKDQRMSVTFPISLAAECKRKWKQDGLWKQTSKPIQAMIICRGRRR